MDKSRVARRMPPARSNAGILQYRMFGLSTLPGLYCEANKLSVRIDKSDTFQWPRKERVQVNDLALGQSHLVTARCAGKPLQAVKFRFSSFKSTHVCVTYDVYGGIYLFDYTMRGWGVSRYLEVPSVLK
jgi:hypothetical protein